MLEAALWGFVSGLALVIGAILGLAFRIPRPVIGHVMAFGGGVLICALTFELTQEAFESGGVQATAFGLALGSLVFFLGNAGLERIGGKDRKRSHGKQAGNAAVGLVVGAVLDGIPESIAIGVSLLRGDGVSVAVVVAVFLSNIPESMSAATGLKAAYSKRAILTLWMAVALVCALASGFGFAALGDASGNTIAFIQAFAAGAILTMLANTMMPEAFEAEHRSNLTGMVTTLGFSLAAILTTLA